MRLRVGIALIEFVLVAAVLLGLTALGLRTVRGFRAGTGAVACESDKRAVRNAAAAYFAENGAFADSVRTLVASGFLGREPGGPGYTITYSPDGTVTASGACT